MTNAPETYQGDPLQSANAALIYAMIWRQSPISRSDLAARSGLTKSTVSSHVGQLLALGLIEETDYRPSGAEGGRRARLLGIRAQSRVVAGIHVGVRQTRVVIADAKGNELEVAISPTRRRQPSETLTTITETVVALLKQGQIPRESLSAIGVAIPGSIDPSTGICRIAPNLGWRDVPVSDILSDALGVPVYGSNTAQAMAVAEAREASSRGEDPDISLLYVGTGVGAASVIGGRLLRGSAGFAGEIGHVSVGSGIPCKCGGTGCLETLVSGPAIARRWNPGATTKAGARRTTTIESVGEAAAAGDKSAREILTAVGLQLGQVAAWIVQITNPRTLVLAGRVSFLGEVLIGAVREGLREAMMPAISDSLTVRRSYLDDAGKIRGAVLTALRQLDHPGALLPGVLPRPPRQPH